MDRCDHLYPDVHPRSDYDCGRTGVKEEEKRGVVKLPSCRSSQNLQVTPNSMLSSLSSDLRVTGTGDVGVVPFSLIVSLKA